MDVHQFIERPDDITKIEKETAVDFLNDVVELLETRKEPMFMRIGDVQKLYFAGDLHGDFTVLKLVVKRFLESEDSALVFLGDIVDRAPRDNPFGSVHSLLLTLFMKLRFPERVFILMGNHEGNHVIPCYPDELRNETVGRFGDARVHESFEKAFRSLPLMGTTGNGIFFSHAGIPKMNDWTNRSRMDEELVAQITWAEPLGHGLNRGFGTQMDFNNANLRDFLDSIGAKVFVRGHGPIALGTVLFKNRCLTLFTSRRYENYGNGGVLLGSVDMDRKINRADEIDVEQLKQGKWLEYRPAILED
jgi:Icc-related predicted phosphoesterase